MALAGLHFDRMAYLADIQPMRLERLDRHGARGARTIEETTAKPAGAAAQQERGEHRGSCETRPFAARTRERLELEARRHRLARDGTIARADRLALSAPGGDARRILGVRVEPLGDRGGAVGGKLAIHVGMQFLLGHWWLAVDHVTSPAAAPAARRQDTP